MKFFLVLFLMLTYCSTTSAGWLKGIGRAGGRVVKSPNIPATVNKEVSYIKGTPKTGVVGRWNRELGKPNPNTIYRVKNAVYATDTLGRTTKVEANLQLDPNWGRNAYITRIVGHSGKSNDVGGHLIGRQFQGAGEKINIVPMDSRVNAANGEWGKLERHWVELLDPNKNNGTKNTVEVRILPQYSGQNIRPNKFIVYETINGKNYPPKTICNDLVKMC